MRIADRLLSGRDKRVRNEIENLSCRRCPHRRNCLLAAAFRQWGRRRHWKVLKLNADSTRIAHGSFRSIAAEAVWRFFRRVRLGGRVFGNRAAWRRVRQGGPYGMGLPPHGI